VPVADKTRKQISSTLPYYLGYLPLGGLVRWLPRQQALKLGAAVGDLLYRTMRRYRVVAQRNLTMAFGWDAGKAEGVARQVFRNLGKTMVEFLRLPSMSPEELRRLCRLEGLEQVHAALAEGRGLLIISAHYGNWELFAARVAAEGIPLSVVARDADDPATNALINGIREGCGYRVIPRQSAPRGVLEALRRNEVVVLLMDQNTVKGGEFVPFFGRLAATATGPALFALRTGACLIPAFVQRQPDDTHIGRTLAPVTPARSGDREQDVRALTAQLTVIIESQVRADPTQWFWIHDRWRHRPAEERLKEKVS
jgi:KDO2-lipid IV(A) lauroyltransferase